jgi:hypothetical protein
MTPTDEQLAIIDAYRTGRNLVIEAGAGTGKTSTLKMLGGERPDRGGTNEQFMAARKRYERALRQASVLTG